MSVAITCDCGKRVETKLKRDQYGLQLVDSIEESGAFVVSATIDYTFLIRCTCGNETEVF